MNYIDEESEKNCLMEFSDVKYKALISICLNSEGYFIGGLLVSNYLILYYRSSASLHCQES